MTHVPNLNGRWVELPWGRLHVWSAGSGPVVVGLHGLGGSGRYWEGLAGRISASHTLVAPDLAGFGRSERPSLQYDRDFHLENLDALVESVAPCGRIILVGHSVGAILAALWAAKNPERVAALALVAAPWPTARRLPPPVRWMRDRPPSRRRGLVGTMLRAIWPIVTLPFVAARRYPRAIVDDFARQSIRARAWTAWSLLGDPVTAEELTEHRGVLGDIQTLLLFAADDRRVPGKDRARWEALLPTAASRLLPWGGHGLLLRTGYETLTRWIHKTTIAQAGR